MPDPKSAHKGQTLKSLIDAGIAARKSYDDVAEEVDKFINDLDYKFLYQNGTDPNLSFYARVSLMGQAVDMFVPQIISANPNRLAHVRNARNPLTKARADLMGQYLNRLPDETNLYDHNCKAAGQGVAHGRSVFWTGWNPRKKIVQTVFDDDKNLVLDPDAKSVELINWCGRKRERPRWEVASLPGVDATAVAAIKDSKKAESGSPTEMICYYEVYMRVGIGRYMKEAGSEPIVDEPVKYLVSADGHLLSEGQWEIPWHIDDAWPFTVCDLRESGLWPKSPLEPGLGHQKALNFLYTDFISKVRASARILMAVLNINGTGPSDDDEANFFDLMNRWPVLKINANGVDNPKIADFFQQMKIDAGIAEFSQAYAIIKQEFEEHTGLYSIFHAGAQSTQDRSAASTQMKDRNSRTRLDAMQHKFERAQSKIARKEALAARFLHSPEEIEAMLGEGTGAIWGQVMPPGDAMMNPNAVDFASFFLETDYSIETGSARRRSIEQQLDVFDKLENTVTSVQLQSADLMEKANAYDVLAEHYKLLGLSEELIDKQKDLAEYFRGQHQMQMAMAQMQPMGAPQTGAPV